MAAKCGYKELFVIISMLLLTDLVILLNILILRQILGFLFLTLLPGLLILQILKLNKIGSTEKFVLSVGLSISFLMFFGLLLNNLLLGLGYETPLATIPVLISFNIVFIVLAIIGYAINKTLVFAFPHFRLTTSEKAFLIVPILFPALSIFGTHVMNTTDNNSILIGLLFLIPIYVAFACFLNQKFSKRLYPVVIFLISISLVMMIALRSNHIIGSDTHYEYYFFKIVSEKLYWHLFGHSTLDACLSISLLPAIYQSILNTSPEYLYKLLYPLILSISPIVIYVLSKKYIGESYAFLASFFFMCGGIFVYTGANPRTGMAILFFALAMMILFNDIIGSQEKKILLILFMGSCMVSHYATTYIFFIIMFGVFIGTELLSKKYVFKKEISLTIVVLFFAMIFFWYSQVTETSFRAGIDFIGNSLTSLNNMFIVELQNEPIRELFGEKITQEGTAYKISYFFTWMTFVYIGIGFITLIIRVFLVLFPELKVKKPEFFKDKFEVEYFITAFACVGILLIVVAVPHLTKGYDVSRPYSVAIVILAPLFAIGGITISKMIFFIKQTFKKHFFESKKVVGKAFLLKERSDRTKASEVLAYLVILLVLIPYFFCVVGVTYAMFETPRSVILASEGKEYDKLYTHDQDSYGAKWLKVYGKYKWLKICTDHDGLYRLMSQGEIYQTHIDDRSLFNNRIPTSNYVYLRYADVIQEKFMGPIILYKANKIYDNDAAIYRN